jgi:transposase-like protein
MSKSRLRQLQTQAQQLGRAQCRALIQALQAHLQASQSVELIEQCALQRGNCPHCQCAGLVRNGRADGLQRFKCRSCGKTFNALTGTPLARLRYKGKWLDQAAALAEGLTVHQAAQRLGVAPSTAFRWRHRFLRAPRLLKPQALAGVVEIDETYVRRSFKGREVVGRAPRRRGGRARMAGLSREQVPVLVAHDRHGNTTDEVLPDCSKPPIVKFLKPLLAADAVVVTDGSTSLGHALRELRLQHHCLSASSGQHAIGAWHVQNVNAYHSRLKLWLRRFHGVATYYLDSYLGWFRALQAMPAGPSRPATLLNLAIGAST